MALNAARNIPYSFRVVELDGIVWLYDDSERTYICSSTPCLFMEPLYWVDGECEDNLPEPSYWEARAIEALESFPVPLDSESVGASVPYKEAWETASQEASANYII